eukprot:jgi/Tetstr1/437603/TSEL_026270.t1
MAGTESWLPPPPSQGGKRELVYPPGAADCASAHGSSLVALPDGGVLAAWFGGSREGARDVAIYAARRSPDGRGWSSPTRIAKVGEEAHWNAVLFWYPSAPGVIPQHAGAVRRLHLHFKVGNSISRWRTYACYSTDSGASWSEPAELVAGDRGGRGCVKNKPVLLDSGGPVIVAGASTEASRWEAFADVSADGGASWTASPAVRVPDGAGVIQPSLWASTGLAVHMLLRSDGGRIYRADSADGGANWSDARPTSMPNNNSGIDVARLSDGTLVLAYNPQSGRHPLSLAMSQDNGGTWRRCYDVERSAGEFSYPAIIPWPEGLGVCLTYTHNRQTVGFLSVSLADLQQPQPQ